MPILIAEVEPPAQLQPMVASVSIPIIIALATLLGLTVIVALMVALAFMIRHWMVQTEDDLWLKEENQAYLELNLDEQELFFQSRDYLLNNPVITGDSSLSQKLAVQEQGIGAYQFQKDAMLSNSDVIIVNKTEVNFFKPFECNAILNLPMMMANDVYYYEAKIYSKTEENTTISIGLSTKPYPWFRLPGRHPHSIVYDLDGQRRHNQPFPLALNPPFHELVEGDVVGVGYRVRLGTVFFTRNGKKVKENALGGHVRNFRPSNNAQIFPIVGANNLCSVHVNLGQMGFVFIEANVKKWGYAPLEGNGPPPPAYNKFNSDILLDRSEIDDSEMSDREHDFPPDFWESIGDDDDKYSYNAYREADNDDRITMASLIPNQPPSYDDEVPMEGSLAIEMESNEEVNDDNQEVVNEAVTNEEVVNEGVTSEEVVNEMANAVASKQVTIENDPNCGKNEAKHVDSLLENAEAATGTKTADNEDHNVLERNESGDSDTHKSRVGSDEASSHGPLPPS